MRFRMHNSIALLCLLVEQKSQPIYPRTLNLQFGLINMASKLKKRKQSTKKEIKSNKIEKKVKNTKQSTNKPWYDPLSLSILDPFLYFYCSLSLSLSLSLHLSLVSLSLSLSTYLPLSVPFTFSFDLYLPSFNLSPFFHSSFYSSFLFFSSFFSVFFCNLSIHFPLSPNFSNFSPPPFFSPPYLPNLLSWFWYSFLWFPLFL